MAHVKTLSFLSAVTAWTLSAPYLGAESSSASGRSLDDFAQIYVNEYFEPSDELSLSEANSLKGNALASYARGRTLEVRGQIAEAVEAYQGVIRIQPDQLYLTRKTAYLLAQLDRKDEGSKLMEESLRRNQGNPFPYIALSEYIATFLGEDEQSFAKSLDISTAALNRFPQESIAYEHLIGLRLMMNDREAALEVLKKASRQEVTDPEFWLRLGHVAARLYPYRPEQDPEGSALLNSFFVNAVQHAGDAMQVYEQAGDFYHATRQFEAAIQSYQRVIDAHPDRLDVMEKMARVHGGMGNEEQVIAVLKGILEVDPQNVRALKQLSGILLRTQQFAEATTYLHRALAITKGSEVEYSALARMMLEHQQWEIALEFIGEASALFPESPEFPLLYTFGHFGLTQYAQALPHFDAVLKLAAQKRPQMLDEMFYFRYAMAYERTADFDKAAEHFKKSIQLLSQNDPRGENTKFASTVYNYLGYMWLENDMNIDEAGELIKTASELDPESGAIADSLGWFFFKKGRYDEAKEALLRAEAKIEAPDAVVFDHIGQLYWVTGEQQKAVEYLKKAVALDPKNDEFASRLEVYEQRVRQSASEKAEKTPSQEAATESEEASSDQESSAAKLPVADSSPTS